MSKVISIDPGYERLGIAVISKKNGKECLEYSECFKTSKDDDQEVRLRQIGEQISKIIEKFKPAALAIESLFFNTNQKTAIKVAEARGVVMNEASKAELKVFEYTPPQIKLAITGYGKSDKTSVMKMIPKLIKIEKEIKSDDEMDAIGVGLTCLAHEQLND